MSSEIALIGRIAPVLAEGLYMTLELSVLAIVLSALWAIPVVLTSISPRRPLALVARAYIEVVRNTPVLVQMYFMFFGSSILGYRLTGFVAGLIALTLQERRLHRRDLPGWYPVGVAAADRVRAWRLG